MLGTAHQEARTEKTSVYCYRHHQFYYWNSISSESQFSAVKEDIRVACVPGSTECMMRENRPSERINYSWLVVLIPTGNRVAAVSLLETKKWNLG